MSLVFDPPTGRRPPDGASRTISTEEAFEALANQRRRYVVHWLLETGTGTEIRQLSRQVAAWENDKPADRVTAQERRRVYNALQQFHLPKLDDAGVVRYDADRGEIDPTDELWELQTYLNAPRRSYRWCSRSLMAGGAFIGLVALLAGLSLFAPLPEIALGVLSGVLILGMLVTRRSRGTPGGPDLPVTETDDRHP